MLWLMVRCELWTVLSKCDADAFCPDLYQDIKRVNLQFSLMFVADIIAMNKEKWEERVALLSTMPREHFNIGDIKQAMNTLWALSIEAIFSMLTHLHSDEYMKC